MAFRKQRNHMLQAAIEESAKVYRQKFIGQTMPVLWESTTEYGEFGWQMEGWTGNYLRISAVAPAPRWNQVDEVQLTEVNGEKIKGNLISALRGAKPLAER